MIGHLWTRPAGVRVQGRAFGARVHKVQKVQRVQSVVVAASPQIKKGGAAPPRVVQKGYVRFAQGATAALPLRVADCPLGNAYKVGVTGFTFSII